MASRRPVPVPVPPDEELEAMLVGYCLDGTVQQLVQVAVESVGDDGVRGRLAPVWRVIREMVLSGVKPTVPEVAQRLGAPWTVSQVLSLVRDDLGGWELARAVDALVELSRRRMVMESLAKAWEAAGKSADEAIALMQDALAHTQAYGSDRYPTLAEVAEVVLAEAEEAYEARAHNRVPASLGLPTGIAPLDALTGGLGPGDVWVLAARTSRGKTSFALQISQLQDVPVHFASAEVPAQRLGRKALGSAALVPVPRIRQGALFDGELDRLRQAVGKIATTQVVVDDRSRTVDALRVAVMRTARRYGSVGLVVVDYMQLLALDRMEARATREERVAAVSRGLKLLALDMRVPVLALAQLSRSAEDGQEPEMRHLRESGAIEQDADVVVFLHRPKGEEDQDADPTAIIPTDLIVAKNRDGPVARVGCGFDPMSQTLVDNETILRRHREEREVMGGG